MYKEENNQFVDPREPSMSKLETLSASTGIGAVMLVGYGAILEFMSSANSGEKPIYYGSALAGISAVSFCASKIKYIAENQKAPKRK